MSSGKNATSKQPQTTASASKPSVPLSSPVKNEAIPSNAFVGMALSMAWQLAVVVLVPILAGHFLDKRWHSTPVVTVIGLIIAAIGVFGVLVSTVRAANAYAAGGSK